jgi:transcriptional activator
VKGRAREAVTRTRGLAVPPGEVDAWAVERLVVTARGLLADGDTAAGAAALRRALGMWRGPALADVADAPFAAATIARLSELRLAALEDRIDADLELGHGAALVPEIDEGLAFGGYMTTHDAQAR